jgi:hypothetical protein
VSISTTTEGWIHNLIDKLYQLQKLLTKVYFIWHFAQRQTNYYLQHPNSPPPHIPPILLHYEGSVRHAKLVLVNLAFVILVVPAFVFSYMTTNELTILFMILGVATVMSLIAFGHLLRKLTTQTISVEIEQDWI